MDTPTSPPAVEIEALRAAYGALNRGDVEGFVAAFDPQVVRVEFEGFPGGGTYRGIEAVKAHVVKGRGGWAEGACEPERFIVAPPTPSSPFDDRIVVLTHVHVRLKSETAWREGRTGDVFTFRNGKVIEFRTFGDVGQALEWAGVTAS